MKLFHFATVTPDYIHNAENYVQNQQSRNFFAGHYSTKSKVQNFKYCKNYFIADPIKLRYVTSRMIYEETFISLRYDKANRRKVLIKLARDEGSALRNEKLASTNHVIYGFRI